MTDFVPQDPAAGTSVAPTYNACTTADTFSASQGGRYMLHYKNGATATTTLVVNEQLASLPPGASPTAPAGATKWSDLVITAALAGNAERVIVIDNISPYINPTDNKVHLQHGTPTTLTLAIFGPLN